MFELEDEMQAEIKELKNQLKKAQVLAMESELILDKIRTGEHIWSEQTQRFKSALLAYKIAAEKPTLTESVAKFLEKLKEKGCDFQISNMIPILDEVFSQRFGREMGVSFKLTSIPENHNDDNHPKIESVKMTLWDRAINKVHELSSNEQKEVCELEDQIRSIWAPFHPVEVVHLGMGCAEENKRYWDIIHEAEASSSKD